QLCIYLAVVVSGGRGWKAGGCLYVPVVDPVASVDRPEDGSDDWRKLLKPHGLIVDDGEAPRLMDAVSSGSSPFLPIFFKRDGTLGATSKAAPPDAFHRLLDYVASKAGSLVETVASGDTSIAPI